MELIKQNKEKNRSVFKLENGNIKKYWHSNDIDWARSHVNILDSVIPGYVIKFGRDDFGVWIEFSCIKGVPANTEEHTDKFIEFIYEGCLKNIRDTAPFSHGDWALSNIFIDSDRLNFCDWDNVGIYGDDTVMDKLHKDLHSAFGDRFYKVTGYDPAGI